ncbi:MAG: hypothetical protein GXP14_13090 [Gammaproteobacteria bacterium]|nr:hypothetical protein [Gammaproteobacteria bacterium]
MKKLHQESLTFMEKAVHYLVKHVQPPVKMPFNDGFVFRYKEETILQAIVQKLARMVTCLHSAKALMECGLFQDQAALQRMLDEFQEDILFLSYGLINEVLPLHKEYLIEFYKEEFDNQESVLKSKQKRGMASRRGIRAYISKIEENKLDPSTGVELSRTLNKAYSGFIHGASPQIMDMFGGVKPHFHVSGMRCTPREQEYQDDILNYFYRGILSFGFSAKAFDNQQLFDDVIKFRTYFERQSGMSYQET